METILAKIGVAIMSVAIIIGGWFGLVPEERQVVIKYITRVEIDQIQLEKYQIQIFDVAKQVDLLQKQIDLMEGAGQIFGGSTVHSRYGGTGKDFSLASGLLRIATGTFATTTLTDADVPDNITITSMPNLTLNTLVVTSTAEFQGTSTFAGTTTFGTIPTLPSSDPTSDNQAVRKKWVDDNFWNIGTTTEPGKALNTDYQNTTGEWMMVMVSGTLDSENGSAFISGKIGVATSSYATVAVIGVALEDSQQQWMRGQLIIMVPDNYYYKMEATTTLSGAVSLSEWWETY